MIDIDKFRAALREAAKGNSPSRVSATLKIPRSTIRGWLDRADALSLTYERIKDKTLSEIRELLVSTSRPVSEAWTIDWDDLLAECAACKLSVQELYERYQKRCPPSSRAMSRSSFYKVYKEKYEAAHPTIKLLYLHNTFAPGSVMMMDYSGNGVAIQATDGSQTTAQIFVGVLGCSGLIFCCATPRQTRKDWISGIVTMLEYFDGVADELWLDNSTALVKTPERALPEINGEFKCFCEYYDTVPHAVAPNEPTYKGLVENAVKQVQHYVLRPLAKRKFFDLKSLNIALTIELDKLNKRPLTTCRKTSRRDRFQRLEQSLLKPLPRLPYTPMMKVIRRKVLKGDQIRLGDIRYNVPWGHVGKVLSVIVDTENRLLRCFCSETGEFIFDTKIRNPEAGDEPMRPEFVVPELRYLALSRKQLVAEISEIGPSAAQLAMHLARQSNSRACVHLREIYRQAGKLSESDFLAICAEALKAPTVDLQAYRKARDAFEAKNKKPKQQHSINKPSSTTSLAPRKPGQVRGAEYFNDDGEKNDED